MPDNFADRLLAAIEEKGSPVCVGIDPRYDRLPQEFHTEGAGNAQCVEAIERWARGVLDVVAPHVPAVKPQSAYFEACGPAGVAAYFNIVNHAQRLGLIVIGDVKRNDIGSTAEAYAAGHLSAQPSPDAITVNGYLGADGIAPFATVCREKGKGIFVPVRTSNTSAGSIQDFADAEGTKFYEHIAAEVARIGSAEGLIGQSGYSCIGAVVGATYPDEARRLRELMPQQLFLVPGYGAQGAKAADCAAAFKADGTGAIVNAARSVIYAHLSDEYKHLDWKQAVAQAAQIFAQDIAGIVGA